MDDFYQPANNFLIFFSMRRFSTEVFKFPQLNKGSQPVGSRFLIIIYTVVNHVGDLSILIGFFQDWETENTVLRIIDNFTSFFLSVWFVSSPCALFYCWWCSRVSKLAWFVSKFISIRGLKIVVKRLQCVCRSFVRSSRKRNGMISSAKLEIDLALLRVSLTDLEAI